MIAVCFVASSHAQEKKSVTPASAAPVERVPDLSDGEKIRQSNAAIAEMRGALKVVLSKVEEARNTKDVVKLNCVNDRLTQVKGLLRISEQADVALQESIARKENSDGEFKVSIARQKVSQLREEAEQCIGQLAFQTDESMSVEVEVPDNLPSGDPSQNSSPAPLTVRPPPASPTL